MIENLQDEFYQIEEKQTKGAKLCANIRSWRPTNAPKLFFKVFERQNMKTSNLRTFLNLEKKIMKLCTK